MTIILFTLVQVDLAYNQRMNPYYQASTINSGGLAYIGSNLTTDIVPALAGKYITDGSDYQTNAVYPQELVFMLAIMGFNVSNDATKSLSGIDLGGGYNVLVQKVFSLIDNFPPNAAATTVEESYVIFNNTGTGGTGMNQVQSQWNLKTTDLLNEILASNLTTDQKALPLIALAMLTNSYNYWQSVYYNTSDPWYTYITGAVSSINDIDWRQVLQMNVKGALAGAVAGRLGMPENPQGGLAIGAAAAGMSASAQSVVNQVNMISVYNP